MREYCTYFDERYLDKALALIRSLDRHAGDYRLHCVTMTAAARAALEKLRLPRVAIVPIEEIEAADEGLRAAKSGRSRLSYYWTTTPAVMLFLLGRGVRHITYLDSDLYFFSDPEVLFKEAEGADLVIHEHRHDRPIVWLRRRGGRFNVGLVGATATTRALAVLKRWRGQCLEHCSDEPGKGGFGDQLYLDEWPQADARLCVLSHPGAGVAPWNVLDSRLQRDGDRVLVNGKPLVFFHFHALIRRPRGGWTLARRYYLPRHVRDWIYRPYLAELQSSVGFLAGALPDFAAPVTPRLIGDWIWDILFSWKPAARVIWWIGSVARG